MALPLISSPILLGEIIQIQKNSDTYPLYMVRVELPNGNSTIISNVISSTIFGGVYDSLQVVRRPSSDKNGDSKPQGIPPNFVKGDRIIVACLGNDYRRGVIIGAINHPRNKYTLPVPDFTKQQMRMSYLGIDFDVDPDGQLIITHKGAPVVTNTNEGPQQDPKNLSNWSMLKDGSSIFSDNNKQTIKIDATNKLISLKSVEESFTLDSGKKLVSINATKNMTTTVKEIYTLTVGTEKLVLDNNASTVLLQSNKTMTLKAGADIKVTGESSLFLDGGKAIVSLKSGKIAIGTSSAELLQILTDFLDALTQAAPIFVSTKMGPGELNPQVIAAASKAKAKIASFKGSI